MLSSSLRWKKKSKFSAKQAIILLSLLIISILPIAFQKEQNYSQGESNRTLTIITSHNETIRNEFARAFTTWWARRNRGEIIYINWVTPGGGAEVRKVIDTRFEMFEKHKGKPGAENVGLDVFFGGGEYEFAQAERAGYLAKLKVFKDFRGLFLPTAEGDASIPQSFNGEVFYDKGHKWVGVCLSSFGIVYNKDVLKRLGYTEDQYPKTWDDLADPRLIKNIALADPTKSGSVTKAFEMILQQKMQEYIAANPKAQPGETQQQHRQRVLNKGWEQGMRLIQKICANARYFSDSASKIPHDVANGDSAVGMCIDFYGRTYNSKHMKQDGSSRVEFVVPTKGSTVSADPIAVFRNAPEPDLAQGFVNFTLSPEGQMLWNGDPKFHDEYPDYVPKKSALRRLPISKDVYHEQFLKFFTDPEDLPYHQKDALKYDGELTAKTFNALRTIIRVMAIDTHEELTAARLAVVEAQQRLGKAPEDLEKKKLFLEVVDKHFHGLSKVSYTKAVADFSSKISKMKNKRKLSARLRDLEKNNFSDERMKHYYPQKPPEEYKAAIAKLRKDVDALRSFDIMTLERQQQELASQFRASYAKAIKNANLIK